MSISLLPAPFAGLPLAGAIEGPAAMLAQENIIEKRQARRQRERQKFLHDRRMEKSPSKTSVSNQRLHQHLLNSGVENHREPWENRK